MTHVGRRYDYCRLCSEGIRKSLKKYDKVNKAMSPGLQKGYLDSIKTQFQFFMYRDNLKDLLTECASFWNDSGAAAGKDSSDIFASLPAAFPLAAQMEDQKKHLGELTETEEEEEEEDEGKEKKREAEDKEQPSTTQGMEEEKDMDFERDFTKQRESKPQWRKQLADYRTLSDLLKKLATVAGMFVCVPTSQN